ncbi:MAG: hypothetical protein D6732_14140, partial [Methanobacteriota archaeon]
TIHKPEVRVANVRFAGLSFEKVDLLFDVQITNPNQLSIHLDAFDYDLQINDASFLKGRQDAGLQILAEQTSHLEIPLSLGFKELYNTFQSLKNQDSTQYRLLGTVYFNLPILGQTAIPVSKEGWLPMVKLPRFTSPNLKIVHLGLTGADVAVNLTIENPNAFGLLLDKLDYSFSVNGTEWAKGVTSRVVQIAEKGMGVVSIPVSLNFLQIGQGVMQLLTGAGQANYSFTGLADIKTTLPMIGNVQLPINKSGELKITR